MTTNPYDFPVAELTPPMTFDMLIKLDVARAAQTAYLRGVAETLASPELVALVAAAKLVLADEDAWRQVHEGDITCGFCAQWDGEHYDDCSWRGLQAILAAYEAKVGADSG